MGAYNASSNIVPTALENKIIKQSTDEIVKNYIRSLPTPRMLYECSKLIIHGTEYNRGQYVILP